MMRSRRRLAGIALVLGASIGLAGCFNVQVTKEVTGGDSLGPFTVTIECTDGQSDQMIFIGPGTQTSDDIDVPTTCTIVEPANAGASGVTFTCVQPPPTGVTCTPGPGGIQIVATEDADFETVEVGVQNDFTPPPTTPPADPGDPGTPAAPVVGTPRFTG